MSRAIFAQFGDSCSRGFHRETRKNLRADEEWFQATAWFATGPRGTGGARDPKDFLSHRRDPGPVKRGKLVQKVSSTPLSEFARQFDYMSWAHMP